MRLPGTTLELNAAIIVDKIVHLIRISSGKSVHPFPETRNKNVRQDNRHDLDEFQSSGSLKLGLAK